MLYNVHNTCVEWGRTNTDWHIEAHQAIGEAADYFWGKDTTVSSQFNIHYSSIADGMWVMFIVTERNLLRCNCQLSAY